MKTSILLLEDDPDLCQILESQLKSAGFAVLSCDRISDALFKLKNQDFSCLVMDVRVKQGDSSSILETLRAGKLGKNSRTPAILISGYFSRTLIEKVAPFKPVLLLKPFDTETLLSRVRESMAPQTQAG